MKLFFIIQAGLLILGAGSLWLINTPQRAASFGVGAIVVLINFAILVFVWQRVLHKKQIALVMSLIVFKYALLGWCLYVVLRSAWVDLFWFSSGLGTLIVSAVGTALISEKEE